LMSVRRRSSLSSPDAAEDVRLIDHAGVDVVLEEWTRRGGRCGAERDRGAGRSGVGT
jgi:hypothetical protein